MGNVAKRWSPIVTTALFGCLCLQSYGKSGIAISLDPKLMKDWTGGASLPCPHSFTATYSKGGKSFVFLAASHVWAPTSESDPRLKIIKNEIESFKPGGVVIERPVSPGTFSVNRLKQEKERCQTPDGKVTCGEPTYAGIIAGGLRATVVGGEKLPTERNADLVKHLGREEVLVYNTILILSSMREKGASVTERRLALKSPLNREMLFNDREWSYAKFDAWLVKNIGAKADDVQTFWIEPRNDQTATATQKIAYQYDAIREPQIVAATEGVINSNTKSMIIYGSGHFVKQAAIYEKVFGAPRIQCLVEHGSKSDLDRAHDGNVELPEPTGHAK